MCDPAPTLARCVGDVERFAELNWSRTAVRRSSGECFDDILSLNSFDDFVASAPRWPAVRAVLDGRDLPRTSFCRPARIGGRTFDDVVAPMAVGDAFVSGATIVGQSLHRQVPAVSSFATALEDEMSHRVQVNAYLSPAGSVGLRSHADGHDVIAIQLHGSKTWNVEGLGDFRLVAGDVLYIPRGVSHAASAQDEPSLHLTVGILSVTYRDVMQRALDDCDMLDQQLPIGFARPGAETRLVGGLRGARSALLDHVDRLDPVALADAERLRRTTRRDHRGHVASVARLAVLDADTVLQITEPRPRVEIAEEGTVRLTTAWGSVVAPARALAALSFLVAERSVRVRDLPGLDSASQVVVARRLVQEGICVIIPPPSITDVASSTTFENCSIDSRPSEVTAVPM